MDANLRPGKVRLVFVADEIPAEPRRVVEFLNSQMALAEAIAVEIRQYAGAGVRALVPTVFGKTRPAPAPSTPWNRERLLAALEERKGPTAREVAEKLLSWAVEWMPQLRWGRGPRIGSCLLAFHHSGIAYGSIAFWTQGSVEVRFGLLKPPMDTQEAKAELAARLNEIPGVNLNPNVPTGCTQFDILLLAKPDAFAKFTAAMEWLVGRVRGD